MKRKLALLLAVVMVLSMIPMMSFAASDNTVDRVPTVADDASFTEGNAPKIRIQEKNVNEFGTGDFQFRLNLTNAEWEDDMFGVTSTVYAGDTSTPIGTVTFTERTSTSANANVTLGSRSDKAFFEIPMVTELQGAGEARVTIDALNSAVSAGTYTFAIGAGGATVATVGSKETVERGNNRTTGSIIIDETVPGAIKDELQRVRFRLPRDFKWDTDTEISLDGITATSFTMDSYVDSNGDLIPILFDATGSATIPAQPTTNSGRDLIIELTPTATSSARGAIIIEPAIEVTRNANHGDIAVSITGLRGDISSETNLVVATYKDFGIEISVEEVKEFYVGRNDVDYITAEIEIKETIANSLFPGRTIDFELPSGVSLTDDFPIKNNRFADENITVDGDELDDREFTYEVQQHAQTQTITFELPLTIEGTNPGDVVLTISGAGIEKTELVVAEGILPVTVEVAEQKGSFEVGRQRQAAPDIIITEAYAGAIRDLDDADELVISVMDQFENSMRFDAADFEVVEGDIEIDDLDVSDAALTLDIKASSEKASVIRLYNIEMTLDRTVPYGTFRLNIGGDALVDNTTSENEFAGRVARFDYIRVGTPTGGVEAPEVVVTIGSTTFFVDGVAETLPVAPYIDAQNRTMLPVSAIGRILGADVDWNAASRTVLVTKGSDRVLLTIGSDTMVVNGMNIPMRSEAVITNDRTFVPVRDLGVALGVTTEWDAATQTVTVK